MAIIINEDNRVLLGKRARGIGINQWALIGGKPDMDETGEEAVIREVKEEIKVRLIKPILWKTESNDKTIPGEVWRTSYYLGNIEGILKPKIDEVSELRYVSSEDLVNFDIAFNHDKVLQEFFGRKR